MKPSVICIGMECGRVAPKWTLKELRLSFQTFSWAFQQFPLWLKRSEIILELKKKVLFYFACGCVILVRITVAFKKISLDLVAQSKGARVVHFGEYSRDFRNFDKDNPFDADSSIIPGRIRITLISVSGTSLYLHQQGNGKISLRRSKPNSFKMWLILNTKNCWRI